MADRLLDGSPAVAAKELRIKEMRLDLHGLRGQVMKYQLEIDRWRDNIERHNASITATEKRIDELTAEIKKLEKETDNNG